MCQVALCGRCISRLQRENQSCVDLVNVERWETFELEECVS